MKQPMIETDEQHDCIWKLLPKYAVFPLATAFAVNCFVYWISRVINEGTVHYCLQFAFEKRIPLFPPSIWIYVLAFVQWIVSYVVIVRQGKQVSYRLISADIIAKFMTLVIFVLLPTTVARPVCDGSDISSRMLRFIWSVDASDNLFPSIHCLESWLCFRATFYMRSYQPAYRWGMFVFTLLVFASVILTAQHTLIDIPAGMLTMEAGLLLSKRVRLDALFDRMGKLVYSRKNTA